MGSRCGQIVHIMPVNCQNSTQLISLLEGPFLMRHDIEIPHLILSVGHLGYYSSIEPHQVPISVLGDDTRADVQDLQGGVVVKGHVVSRQQTLSFVIKLHLVLEDIVS